MEIILQDILRIVVKFLGMGLGEKETMRRKSAASKVGNRCVCGWGNMCLNGQVELSVVMG